MIKRLLEEYSINKKDDCLTKEQEAVIFHDIEIINFKRMRIFLILLLITEIMFMIFVDIPNLTSSINMIWSDGRYFILHILVSLVSSGGIIIIESLIKNDRGELKPIHRVIIPALTMMILVLMSMINGLDQIKIGYSGSVFISNIIICCAVFSIRFPINLLVYSVPFSTFIVGLLFFQKNPVLLNSNIINGSIFFIAVIIISKIIYDSQFNQMSKNILLEEANRKLNYMSTHDPLTGLSNRRNFEIHAEQRMKIINQHGGGSVLLLMDIDYFKNINDKFGHPVGDMVLKEVSNVLLGNIKDTDLATRWGGEEFLILLFQTSMDEACILSDKIRAAIEKMIIIIDNTKINVTASFGLAQIRGNFSNSFDASYKLADKALYKAKEQGRNKVVAAKEE